MFGRFVVFEGTGNSGKTTMIRKVVEKAVETYGRDHVVVLKFPSEDALGSVARRYRERDPGTPLADGVLMPLFLCDMLDVQIRVLTPALRAGKLVICDRSFMSTLVYQQSHWSTASIWGLIRDLHLLTPDLLYLLEPPIDVLIERFARRGAEKDRWDEVSVDELLAQRKRYGEVAETLSRLPSMTPGGVRIITGGAGESNDVFAVVWEGIRAAYQPAL